MKNGKSPVQTLGVVLIALLGMAAIAQATPITNFGPDLEMSTPIAGHTQKLTATVVPAAAVRAEEKINSASTAGPSLCELTNSCKTTLKVPEPQSLVMFGTGLLSMAGMIRRKLLR